MSETSHRWTDSGCGSDLVTCHRLGMFHVFVHSWFHSDLSTITRCDSNPSELNGFFLHWMMMSEHHCPMNFKKILNSHSNPVDLICILTCLSHFCPCRFKHSSETVWGVVTCLSRYVSFLPPSGMKLVGRRRPSPPACSFSSSVRMKSWNNESDLNFVCQISSQTQQRASLSSLRTGSNNGRKLTC